MSKEKKPDPQGYTPPASLESEQAVLGCCLIRPSIIDEIVDQLSEEDFYSSAHQTIFHAIIDLYGAQEPIDLVTINSYLKDRNKLEGVGGAVYLAGLSEAVGFAVNYKSYANKIRQKAILRRLLGASQEIASACLAPVDDVEEFIDEAENKIFLINERREDQAVHTLEDLVPKEIKRIEDIYQRKREVLGIPSGFTDLDRLTSGWQNSDLIILAARPSMGKAQGLSARILMANGEWKSMGDIALGDLVASVDGQPSSVIGVYPQGERDIYAITLSDKRVVEGTKEHLWEIESSRFTGKRIVETTTLSDMIAKVRHKDRTRLVQHSGLFGSVDDIGIDPWLLGILLADGCLMRAGCQFSNPENYIIKRIEYITRMELRGNNKKDWRIFHARGVPHPIRESLKCLGVMDLLSHEKFIPSVVFRGVRSVREGVLVGLLEGDGWVEKSGCIQFSSSSKDLSHGLVLLVQSLGGAARFRTKEEPKYTYKESKLTGKPAYTVAIALPGIEKIIASPRLRRNLRVRSRSTSPTVSSVSFVRKELAQCIQVSHPSQKYITDGYVVTHNTALALNMAYNAGKVEVSTAFFSLEQPKEQLIQRLLASTGHINASNLRSARMAGEDWAKMQVAGGELIDLPIHIIDRPALTSLEVRSQARRLKSREGIGLIIIDYLQLMRDPKARSREQEIGGISRGLKALAKELNIPVIALCQLNREVEKRPNKRPVLSDLRESGAIEQDADVVILLYRDEVYREDSPDKGVAEIRLAKHRNGATGRFKLAFQKEFMLFQNYAEQPADAGY